MNPSQTPVFDQYWSLSDTKDFLEGYAASPKDNRGPDYHAWVKNTFSPLMDRLHDAVGNYLVALGRAGRLGPLPDLEGTSVRWFHNWERLRTGSLDAFDARDMGIARGAFTRLAGGSRQAGDPDALHQDIVAFVSAGCFADYEIADLSECALTGEKFSIQMENWQPTVGRIMKVPGAAFGIDFVPLKGGEFKSPGIEHAVVSFPSGVVLIDDWFRIPEFQQAVERAKGEGRFNINALAGRAQQTKCYAEKLGFVSVSVGNSVPSVVMQDGAIKVGRLRWNDELDDYEVPKGNRLGLVCTDLWWASMIDKEVLTKIVAQTCSMDQAQKKVEGLIKERAGTMMTTHLPPGDYHLYFSGDESVFKQLFNSPDMSMDEFVDPMLALSPTPLSLSPPAPKPRKKRTKPV